MTYLLINLCTKLYFLRELKAVVEADCPLGPDMLFRRAGPVGRAEEAVVMDQEKGNRRLKP